MKKYCRKCHLEIFISGRDILTVKGKSDSGSINWYLACPGSVEQLKKFPTYSFWAEETRVHLELRKGLSRHEYDKFTSLVIESMNIGEE